MECRRRGIDIPRQLSVMGFGDFEIGQQMVPPLTTISVDFSGLGRRAGEMIIDLLRHGVAGQETRQNNSIDVGFTLIPRGTTCAARDQGGREGA
jgi:LacI family gluconate utilization system Gnt-I transcriptional repressor